MDKNAGDLFVKALENQGIEYIFGIPGEENLYLLEALRKSEIKFITTHHEQGAGFMASAYGRLTGKVGVALSTLGPGATNLLTPIAYSFLGGFPSLFITGQKPIYQGKQGKFQIVDILGIMEKVTKSSKGILNIKEINNIINESIFLSLDGRKGPTHIEFAEDISAQKFESLNPNKVFKNDNLEFKNEDVLNFKNFLESAKHPLFILGREMNQGILSIKMTDFINKNKLPFITTQMGKGSVSEDLPYFLGTTSLSRNDYIHQAISSSDTIFILGHDIMEKPPFIFDEENMLNKKVIHINSYPLVKDKVYLPNFEILVNLEEFLNKINSLELNNTNWDFSYFYQVKNKLELNVKEFDENNNFPLRPEKIVYDVRQVMSKEDIVSLDNGMYKIYFARNYKALGSNTLLLDNNLATMGAGLPVAMTAKLLFPSHRVLAVVGDGGFMMNVAELETAKRLNLDLVILILNDSGYGMIKWHQEEMNIPYYALDFNNPDFVKLAESFGCNGYKLKEGDNLIQILEDAFNKKGIHIIDCKIDYSHHKEALRKITKEDIIN